jgi:acyl transferase domain-containing protein/acyl-CoA synthetase (AMP-forming)/AMP-acid ligase II/acyl carrier protein
MGIIQKQITFKYESLVEMINYQAMNRPDKIAYIYLNYITDGDPQEDSMTYRQLDQNAKKIAVELRKAAKPNDRVLLLYAPGLDYISAFFGCLYAGNIAVPAYPPLDKRLINRLRLIISDSQADLVLTTSGILAAVQSHFPDLPELRTLSWITTDNLPAGLCDEWTRTDVDKDSIAFLQYTSGSTSAPKGVILTHGNLLHNISLVEKCFGHTTDECGVIWLPPYHDMGLIGGILQSAYIGASVVLLSPLDFLQQPMRWLEAITKYKPVTSGGPNFAYELCIKKINPDKISSLDLSSWSLAFNGAEPVKLETMKKFSQTFKSCGFKPEAFYPCYGLAESSLIVTGGSKHEFPVIKIFDKSAIENSRMREVGESDINAKFHVSSGRVLSDVTIRIVDPETMRSVSENQIGEIWVNSPSVARGYWGKPEISEKTFNAYMADTGEGPFLRTGDLGCMMDGELFVTGRLKDLIILNGRNIYPQDIEYTVERVHPSLRSGCGAAFSVHVDNEEKIVVVQEIKNKVKQDDMHSILGRIHDEIVSEHNINPHAIVLLKAGSIPKTSSGKIQRHLCRINYDNKTLDVVEVWDHSLGSADMPKWTEPETRSSEGSSDSAGRRTIHGSILTWLVERIAERLQVSPDKINTKETFNHFGLESRDAVTLSGELEVFLGRRLSPTLLYDYPNIELLAQHLSGREPHNKLQRKIKSSNAGGGNAVAIIGMSCRFPGGANDPESFWRRLCDGADLTGTVPSSRYNEFESCMAGLSLPDSDNILHGGFLDAIDRFDASFFRISSLEAKFMDPQQRLLLEVSFEALENAGISPDALRSSSTGVFIGITGSDYGRIISKNPDNVSPYMGTGNALSIAANRLSYVFDLRGPSVSIDTACSSSLVALHQACASIQHGDCDMAFVGGVNVLLSPELTVVFSQAKMLAADGKCKTFDDSADGYVRGEGAGVVIIKKLERALQDGDRILAVIRGSAVNQDGRSNGLTAPNGPSQEDVILRALQMADVTPDEIGYIEAHGTGTPLGDPVEVKAIGNILCRDNDRKDVLYIGSVKTNIGHLEAAAGMAGLIKVVQMLTHEMIAPHINFRVPNALIAWDELPIVVPAAAVEWPRRDRRRVAGVSSFGFGGTNAHVIVEEAPLRGKSVRGSDRPLHQLNLSAKTENSLTELAGRYASHLRETSLELGDVCYTANTGRSHFQYRLSAIGETKERIIELLESYRAGAEMPGLITKPFVMEKQPRAAFLFTGQGSQYPGMGRELYETQPVFREVIERCDAILRRYCEHSLKEVLYSDKMNALLDRTAYTQAALFSLEYALYKVWRSWGIVPSIVMGHSVGEYTAACAAGVFSLEDGLRMVVERGRLAERLPEKGEMAVVLAGKEKVGEALEEYGGDVSIAAVNGPECVVISGRMDAMGLACRKFESEGVLVERLRISQAFHSFLVEPMMTEYEKALREVRYGKPEIRMVSNLTGEVATEAIATPEYWLEHLRQPVRFSDGMQALYSEGCRIFLETGPRVNLLSMGYSCLNDGNCLWLPSLQPGITDWQRMLATLGELYVNGVQIDWPGFDRGYAREKTLLPTYAFQRNRYWYEDEEDEEEKRSAVSETVRGGMEDEIIKTLRDGDTGRMLALAEKEGRVSDEEKTAFVSVMGRLHEQMRKHEAGHRVQKWLYEIMWKKMEKEEGNERPGAEAPEGSWMIFADGRGTGRVLADELKKRGNDVVIVTRGACCRDAGDGTWEIDPKKREDYETVYAEAVRKKDRPPTGIVHLWSMDAVATEALTEELLDEAQEIGCVSVLYALQTILKGGSGMMPKMWLVTRGAVFVEECARSISVAQAPLWGLGKVMALEHPELYGGMIDLDPDDNDAVMELIDVLSSNTHEEQVAIRRKTRYVPRLVHASNHKINRKLTNGELVKSENSYLITGGLGYLGLQVARWIAGKGAKHLILVGRGGASSDQARQTVDDLRKSGVQITIGKCDVADYKEMKRIIETAQAEMPPLKGVVHTAGAVGWDLLKDMKHDGLKSIIRPKVQGTWVIHKLLAQHELDFFVSFSSIASTWGSKGHGHYASANQFLDAMAAHGRRCGMPALAVNWGPWNGGGMTVNEFQNWLAQLGIYGMDIEDGIRAFEMLLGSDFSQVVVANIDWKLFKSIFAAKARKPFFDLQDAEKNEEPGGKEKHRSKIMHQLEESPVERRLPLLIEYIQKELAKVLWSEPNKLPHIEQGLFDMGIDSLAAVQFKTRLEKNLGIELKTTVVFDYPTIKQLAEYLCAKEFRWDVAGTKDNDRANRINDNADLMSDIVMLSDESVNSYIEEELSALQDLIN